MTVFDALDAIAAESVSLLLSEPVVWRPMRQSSTGGVYTTVVGGEPDDERPVRELRAITSWRPEGIPLDPGSQGAPGAMGEATLLVDFSAHAFETDEWETYGKPRVKDRFELPEQNYGDRLVEVTRIGDDGSERFYAWCSIIRE